MSNGDIPDPVDRRRHEEALHLRINELEHETQRLRRLTLLLGVGTIGAVALAIAGLSLAGAQADREGIETGSIVLRDATGIARGEWRIDDNGRTTLTLNDRNGIGRTRLTVFENGAPGIALADARGRPRALLSLEPDMTGTLAFADDEGRTRSVFGLAADGSASLAFVDPYGSTRAGFGVDIDGEPIFTMVESDSGGESDEPGSRQRP